MVNKKARMTLKEVFLQEEPADNNVVSFSAFKDKKEREGKRFGMLVSTDGQMLIHPDDLQYVIITSEEQGNALADGDLELAKELGATLFEVGPGKLL